MLVKVCGMRDKENIQQVLSIAPNYMGLIFYSKSPRYVGNEYQPHLCQNFAPTNKVGVFVNEPIESVLQKAELFGLQTIQLHGNETPDYCKELKSKGFAIFKAFGISNKTDFIACEEYTPFVNYFLFDTKSSNYGGTGIKFDWEILSGYNNNTPFLLSGGITINDVETIKNISHPKFIGVDLNSGFELKPALKDIILLKKFIEEIKH